MYSEGHRDTDIANTSEGHGLASLLRLIHLCSCMAKIRQDHLVDIQCKEKGSLKTEKIIDLIKMTGTTAPLISK